MSFLIKIIAYLISIPARLKGMRFGRNSYIGPGYDFLMVNLNGIRLGDNVMIGRRAWLQTVPIGKTHPIISIDDGTNIGRDVTISAAKKIKIGKNCLLSYGVSILDHDHEVTKRKISPMKGKISRAKTITIEDDCFIGAHSFILKGVHLGKHCVVGANSVVTKSFPDYSIVAGNPAKIVKLVK